MKIITSHPIQDTYLYSLNHLSTSVWILMQILKNNFDTYKVVEKVIAWMIVEFDMLWKESLSIKCLLGSDQIHNASRWEIIRVLFRILINSIYKNDPNLGNFNMNYISSSRKILDSNLFENCCTLIEEWNEQNE